MKYTIIKYLDSGSDGSVHLAEYEGKFFALKESHDSKKEFEILSKFDHPNILKPVEYYKYYDHCEYIVTEYCYITLLDILDNTPIIDEDLIVKWGLEIISGLEYIHSKGWVHNDIKLNNVMVSWSNSAKIIDVSKTFPIYEGDEHIYKTGCYYYATDREIQGKSYGVEKDVWSLGVILFVLVTHDYPFMFDHSIIDASYLEDDIPSNWSELFKKVFKNKCSLSDLKSELLKIKN